MIGIVSPPMARARSLVCNYIGTKGTTTNAANYTSTFTVPAALGDTSHPNRKLALIIGYYYDATVFAAIASATCGGRAAISIDNGAGSAGSGNIIGGNVDADGSARFNISAILFDVTDLGDTPSITVTFDNTAWGVQGFYWVVLDGDLMDAQTGTDGSASAPSGCSLTFGGIVGGLSLIVGMSRDTVQCTTSNTAAGTGTIDASMALDVDTTTSDFYLRVVSYRGATSAAPVVNLVVPTATARSMLFGYHFKPTEKR